MASRQRSNVSMIKTIARVTNLVLPSFLSSNGDLTHNARTKRQGAEQEVEMSQAARDWTSQSPKERKQAHSDTLNPPKPTQPQECQDLTLFRTQLISELSKLSVMLASASPRAIKAAQQQKELDDWTAIQMMFQNKCKVLYLKSFSTLSKHRVEEENVKVLLTLRN